MADLSIADRDAALRLLFGGTLYLGLMHEQGEEEADPAYKRRPVTLSEPQGDDVRFVTNTEPVIFPEYKADAAEPVRYAFLSAEPEGGEVKWSDRLERARTPLRGDFVIFPAGSFRIGVA